MALGATEIMALADRSVGYQSCWHWTAIGTYRLFLKDIGTALVVSLNKNAECFAFSQHATALGACYSSGGNSSSRSVQLQLNLFFYHHPPPHKRSAGNGLLPQPQGSIWRVHVSRDRVLLAKVRRLRAGVQFARLPVQPGHDDHNVANAYSRNSRRSRMPTGLVL